MWNVNVDAGSNVESRQPPTSSPSLPIEESEETPTSVDSDVPSDVPSDAPSDMPSDITSSDAPSLVPTLNSGTPTTTQSISEDCESSSDNFLTCLAADESDVSGCDACVATILQNTDEADGSDCDAYEKVICDAIEFCPCGLCVADLETFLNCNVGSAVGCLLSCTSTATPTESPVVAAPTDTPVAATTIVPTKMDGALTVAPTSCEGNADILKTCFVDELSGGDECDQCVAVVLEGFDTGEDIDCDEYETAVCGALTTCSCDSCVDELQTFVNCNVAAKVGCTLSCLDVAPTATATMMPSSITDVSSIAPTSCEGSTATVQTCLAEELTNGTACDQCVATVVQSFTTTNETVNCTEFEEAVCSAVTTTCPCGSCADDLQTFLNCNVAPDIGCSISCFNPTTESPTPSAPTVSAPATGRSCNAIQSDAISCLADNGDLESDCNR